MTQTPVGNRPCKPHVQSTWRRPQDIQTWPDLLPFGNDVRDIPRVAEGLYGALASRELVQFETSRKTYWASGNIKVLRRCKGYRSQYIVLHEDGESSSTLQIYDGFPKKSRFATSKGGVYNLWIADDSIPKYARPRVEV